MDKEKAYYMRWRFIAVAVKNFMKRKFNMEYEECIPDEPSLIISNHVTNWDPIIIGLLFPKTPIYFVASEHIFRLGFLSKVLIAIFHPIAKRKGTSDVMTVREIIAAAKKGETVGLFAEGATSWDGVTAQISPSTAGLVKMSGLPLITCRIEGGYLSLPRWSKKVRKGKMHVSVIARYSKEELKKMNKDELQRQIQSDIHEDAWERQSEEHQIFASKAPAKGLEKALYLCPECKKTGELRSSDNRFYCSCGFNTTVTQEGFFEPAKPFKTIREWNSWQISRIQNNDWDHGEKLFEDKTFSLKQVLSGHRQKELCSGTLIQYEDSISIEGRTFKLKDIVNMSVVQANILVFSTSENYYELKTKDGCSVVKYRLFWENNHNRE